MQRVVLAVLGRPAASRACLDAATQAAIVLGGARIVAMVTRIDPETTILPSEEVLTAERRAEIERQNDAVIASLRTSFGEWQSAGRSDSEWFEVRGTIEAEFRGPGYAQDDWVRLHGYSNMRWETIVNVWFQYNTLLVGLLDRIPDDRLETPCYIGASPAVTLRFVIEDYILHMQHHIDQLLGREVITQYPGAVMGATI